MYFLDFEASGLELPESFPIEAGWARLNTNLSISHGGSVLIRPVAEWTHWNTESQGIHGIARETLESGDEVAVVARRLNETFGERQVVCDGGKWDRHWARRLYDAAGLRPTWTIIDLNIVVMDLSVGFGIKPSVCNEALTVLSTLKHIHRAEADAHLIAKTLASYIAAWK